MKDYKAAAAKLLAEGIKTLASARGAEVKPSARAVKADITEPPDISMGDYAYPCFKLAREFRAPPPAVAASVAAAISDKSDAKGIFSVAEAAGGYVNLKLNRPAFIADTVNSVLKAGADFGGGADGAGKTICIDYSSVNIAKPFHMGHLANTVLGGSLYRIYKFLGYKVVGINHLGDYGTQFGNLIAAYEKWGNAADLKERGVNALLDLYVKFHAEAEKNPALEAEGRARFRAIEQNEAEAAQTFRLFKEITLREVKEVYADLNAEFDSWDGESFFTDKMPAVVRELREKGLLKESEGAQIVDLEKFNLPPALVLKNDGTSLYLTRDIAAALYRKKTYDFDKCLYVVAYQQNLHFAQLFAVLELMGKKWAEDCVHVSYGMVSLPDGAMSTRKGKAVFLKDVLLKAREKTLEIINAKNPDLPNKEETARKVGVGAVIYGALYGAKNKDTVFDYDKALNFDGETGPYVMYTCARCFGVLRRAEKSAAFTPLKKTEIPFIDNPEAFALAKTLYKFPAAVRTAAEQYEPSVITRLITDAAQAFNKFYLERKILTDNPAETSSRLKLTRAAHDVLRTGMGLILLSPPAQM